MIEAKKFDIQLKAPDGRVIGQFWPNTLMAQSGSRRQSQRLADAISTTFLKPTQDPNVIAERDKYIFRMSDYATMPTPNIKLKDFSPNRNPLARLIESTLMPADSPQFIRLVTHAINPSTTRDFWHARDGEGRKLIEDFDQVAFEAISDTYGLANAATARDLYRERITEANRVLATFPNEIDPLNSAKQGLINETDMRLFSPGYLVFLALTPNHAVPRLQYEALRTFTAAELLFQNDRFAKNVGPLVGDLQAAIGDTLFDHGQRIGETHDKDIYAFFDIETGGLLWNSQTGGRITREQLEGYQGTAMLKKFDWDVRDSKEAGPIKTEARTKGLRSIFEKIAREALKRSKLVDDSYMDPSSITDLGGIKQVVLKATSVDGKDMDLFIERHKEAALMIFGPDVEFVEQNETSGENAGSKERGFRRVNVITTIEGKRYQIELLFETLESYLNGEYKYGKIDKITGLRGSLAHPLYEIVRKIRAAKLFFPEEHYGEFNWDLAAVNASEKEVQNIQSRDRVPFSALPQEYMEDDAIADIPIIPVIEIFAFRPKGKVGPSLSAAA